MAIRNSQSVNQLIALLQHLNGSDFKRYRALAKRSYLLPNQRIDFVHIQASPGAFPASVCHMVVPKETLGLPQHCFLNPYRQMATIDFILRTLYQVIQQHTHPNRGAMGSGSFQPLILPPQVLDRNGVWFSETEVRIALQISLPGSNENRILGDEAIAMLVLEVPAISNALKTAIVHPINLRQHCDVVEDFFSLQNRLEHHEVVAFIADDTILPRQSANSQLPLEIAAVAIDTPECLAITVVLPNVGEIRGWAIHKGVTVIIGSSFQGKSTLLNALAKCIYPHIPGDGRERVVSHKDAFFVSAEEGRSVNGVDISAFVPQLPGSIDPQQFESNNASGSTSQAATVVEAIQSNAKLLLLDEDSCATNFLIRDGMMRQLLPEDKSTSLHDHIQELHSRLGISTVIAVGSCSEYLATADHVVAMQNYQPVSMDAGVRRLSLKSILPSTATIKPSDRRVLAPEHLDPSYHVKRLDKTIAVRIKPLRLQEKVLEFGQQQLDLRQMAALVDPSQVLAIGYALLYARNQYGHTRLSPTQLAHELCQQISSKGLDLLCPAVDKKMFFANFRPLELAGAINRLKRLV